MSETQTITIDGVEYDVAFLSDEAKTQIANIQLTDTEIETLQRQVSIMQTARAAYARALAEALPNNTPNAH